MLLVYCFYMGIISNSQCNHHEEIKLCSKICLKTIIGHFPMYYISYTVGDENYTLRRKKTQIICHYGFFLLDISLICVPITFISLSVLFLVKSYPTFSLVTNGIISFYFYPLVKIYFSIRFIKMRLFNEYLF